MVARVIVALGSILADAQDRGLTVHNAVRERGRSRKGKKKSKAGQKVKLKIGRDIPSPEEMRAILNAAGPREKPLLMTAALSGRASWLSLGKRRSRSWRDQGPPACRSLS